MIQSDYVRRLIEQLGKALRAILQAEQTGDRRGLEQHFETGGKTLLGFDLKLLDALDEPALRKFFQPDAELDAGKCLAAAMLLREKASRFADELDENRRLLLNQKALFLLTIALEESPVLRETEFAAAFPEMLAAVPVESRTAGILGALRDYNETLGAFAKCEDVLFEQVAQQFISIDDAQDFLRDLLRRSDAELSAGNLPRSEIEEAIAELEYRKKPHPKLPKLTR